MLVDAAAWLARLRAVPPIGHWVIQNDEDWICGLRPTSRSYALYGEAVRVAELCDHLVFVSQVVRIKASWGTGWSLGIGHGPFGSTEAARDEYDRESDRQAAQDSNECSR